MSLAACHQAEPNPPAPTRVRVQTLEAESSPSARPSLPGTVAARVESTLSFRVGGRIVSRPADIGLRLERDGLVAQLDPEPFKLAVDEATAQVAQARLSLERSRRDVARHRELVDKGAIARADFDALETGLGNAQAQYEAAKSRLGQARNNLAYADLSIPTDGVVTQVHAQVGQVVAAGTPVATIAYDGAREIQADVPENQIAGLTSGAPAEAVLLSAPESRLQGHIREISPVADPATRTYRVRITLQDMPETARLGMTASVHLGPSGALTASSQSRFRLPLGALTQEGGQTAVWVLPEGADTLELRPVTVERMSSDHIIVNQGLQAGERVVTAGVHRLDAGMKVQVWDGRLP
ncbi:efflux RND transporter periplasmic adaptor subunit [Pusillimonas sp. CC-YST705]|uniref:Efflux RND transporter periplasmic adaptor subunit n=1 Tax=Mesopusillimonas faecipullorum TaxID=2755040 RepID=A0ABS8C8R5_9BURK|nr:efflux RND transporter periplasmic adaptor subunit [Mesopusillimonas faecipullorum]MCB5362414.1 efflux RND transporter periplasmic adaptor subunit [Mesopusillimonas faecipullorum]